MPTSVSTQHGQVHLFGLAMTTAKCFSVADGTTELFSAFVMPNVQSADLTHEGESERIKSSSGDYTGIILSGEKLSCSFDVVPEATWNTNTATTMTNAGQSASLPPLGATFKLNGLPVIAAGSFTDAFNVAASGVPAGNRWIYEGGGSESGKATSHYTMKITLHRYPAITGLNPAVVN